MCETLLVRRVVQSFGIARTGSRIQNRMTQILSSMGLNCTRENGQLVFWKVGQKPESCTGFRVSGTEESNREARDVPVQRISQAKSELKKTHLAWGWLDLLANLAVGVNGDGGKLSFDWYVMGAVF